MIRAAADAGFAARLVARARAAAETRAMRIALVRGDASPPRPHRWRRAERLWPLFAKG